MPETTRKIIITIKAQPLNESNQVDCNINTEAVGKFDSIAEVIKFMQFAIEDLKKIGGI